VAKYYVYIIKKLTSLTYSRLILQTAASEKLRARPRKFNAHPIATQFWSRQMRYSHDWYWCNSI